MKNRSAVFKGATLSSASRTRCATDSPNTCPGSRLPWSGGPGQKWPGFLLVKDEIKLSPIQPAWDRSTS